MLIVMVVPREVTPIATCTPCVTAKMGKKGTFVMVRRDTRVSRLGYEKHEKSEKKKG